MIQIFNEIVTVKSNKLIAQNIYETYLYAPLISKTIKPGQFINILPSSNWNHVMRRPMSVASQNNEEISIIYKVFGEGTMLMSNWKKNDKIDIIGPLGNYWTKFKNIYPILIAGGVGIAPIINLHDKLNLLGINHILIIGAKKKDEHFLRHNPDKNIFLATDNSKYGIKGNVIDAYKFITTKIKYKKNKIFACGPHGMMVSIKNYSEKNNIDCDLALETIMACGIGICQGCTIERKNKSNNNSYRDKYALACIDGPIFNIKELSNVL